MRGCWGDCKLNTHKGRANEKLDFEPYINSILAENERQAILELLLEFSDCFASSSRDLGCSNLVQHGFDTGENRSVHQPPYPSAFKARDAIQEQVREMLEAGVIEPSSSPWASPVVLTKKKDGT